MQSAEILNLILLAVLALSTFLVGRYESRVKTLEAVNAEKDELLGKWFETAQSEMRGRHAAEEALRQCERANIIEKARRN